MNLRTRTAAVAAVLLALAGGDPATGADEPKTVPQGPQLNPIDPNRVWQDKINITGTWSAETMTGSSPDGGSRAKSTPAGRPGPRKDVRGGRSRVVEQLTKFMSE